MVLFFQFVYYKEAQYFNVIIKQIFNMNIYLLTIIYIQTGFRLASTKYYEKQRSFNKTLYALKTSKHSLYIYL